MAEAKSTVTIEAEVRLCVSDDTAMTCLNRLDGGRGLAVSQHERYRALQSVR